MFPTAKRGSLYEQGETSIHLPANLVNLGKKRVGENLPETAESTKKSLRPAVGKRVNGVS